MKAKYLKTLAAEGNMYKIDTAEVESQYKQWKCY